MYSARAEYSALRSHSRTSLMFWPIIKGSMCCILGKPSRKMMRSTSLSAWCISSIDSSRSFLASLEESIEEMHHADKLVDRIIFLEGFPNMQHIDPLMIGQNIKEVLECDLKAEYSARALYMEARAACRKEEDYVSMDLFEELLADEEGHINH